MDPSNGRLVGGGCGSEVSCYRGLGVLRIWEDSLWGHNWEDGVKERVGGLQLLHQLIIISIRTILIFALGVS